jgi:hypothetical protein
MKTSLLTAAITLSLITATVAHAESEGAGDPFPFRVPGQTFAVTRPNTASITGSVAGVDAANSLPRSLPEGAMGYAQTQSQARSPDQRTGPPEVAARPNTRGRAG